MDFRSDTVTQPTEEMRQAMASAPVGDDVYGDDPTVNELQDYAAGLMGTEAALYACSGTMGNLIALMAHTSRGEGVLMGVNSHTWKNEGGNVANLAGLMPYPLDDASGAPTLESIAMAYQPAGNVHYAVTKLLVMENTHNYTGGQPIDVTTFTAVADTAKSMGMNVHVDGARIFNATAYFGVDVKEYVSRVDSIQVCLSKGLGAPMGSLLCGKRDFIERARKYRKSLGGGQRQVGIAAAAGLVALRDMRGRLAEDHANADLLADLLLEAGVNVETVARRTNMVYFKLPDILPANKFVANCRELGLLLGAAGENRVRMVTHLGVDDSAVREAAKIVKEVLSR